ncbi:FAT4-like protein [Mya arenaria]|uniref:FAT4-like protein n=1 Tax=Mya arenaria TaxID=6604 RepID=A0ABY7EG10_MYAAR|nr:FAT4-like protein [Mya arenaria]
MLVPLALVVWFLYVSLVIGLNTSCCDSYHLKRQNGELWTCDNCPPGYHFVDDCEFNGGSAKCSPCSNGYYMEARNVLRACRKCKSTCPNYTIINFNCTSTLDLQCGCSYDKYLDKDVCVAKTKCQPGFGVSEITAEGDTKCVTCPEGTISPNLSFDEKCMPDTEDCVPMPCMNNGACTDLVDDLNCICPAAFSGRRCEHDTDDCVPVPCMNNGTCTDLVDGFICICQAGFSGRSCEHGKPKN